MLSIQREKPLLTCFVIHKLPGRIRVGCRALYYLEKYAKDLEKQIKKSFSITSAKINIMTKNVLIHYQEDDFFSEEDILEYLETIISNYSLIAYKAERESNNQLTVNERRLQEESISSMVKEVALLGTAVLYSIFFKRNRIIPTSILRRFLTVPAVITLVASKPIFESGIDSIRKSHKPNADTLSIMAIVTSLLAGRDVSALAVVFLHEIAELLTAYTMRRTRNAISGMLSTGEDYVWKQLEGGKVVKVKVELVEKGDQLVVHTGEKISVDGAVSNGEGVIDESSITGEFFPVSKKIGDHVYAGTVVKSGTLTIDTVKVGDETAVSRIINMVEEASHRKAHIQTYADKFSAQLIPLNFLLAGLVFATTKSITRALNMLIIDYSCGIRLSTATALSAAINTAARNNILIKGSDYIETLAESDTLILDKTGTITKGNPDVITIAPADDKMKPETLMEYASAAEETSTHPMAHAIISKTKRMALTIPEHGEITIQIARGVQTTIDDSIIRVGNKKFMTENSIDVAPMKDKITSMILRGENVIYVGKDDKILGVIGIQDSLRENMKKSLNRLRNNGVDDIILLTGDQEQQAEIVATRMALDRFESELLPEDKAKSILQLQSKGSKVVMIGDGINDGPALAYSDVGIALGSKRTDLAIEAADITIASDNPMLIPGVYHLSKKTMQIVKQNFATAIGINTAGLVLGAIGILPVFYGAVLHNSSTILVVANSLRLLFEDLESR